MRSIKRITVFPIYEDFTITFRNLDVNECLEAERPAKCPSEGRYECINLEPGYECRCPDGYLLNEQTAICQKSQYCTVLHTDQ